MLRGHFHAAESNHVPLLDPKREMLLIMQAQSRVCDHGSNWDNVWLEKQVIPQHSDGLALP